MSTQNKPRVSSIREVIERDIGSGKLTTGQELDEEAFAAQYGASRTLVREPIQQLSSQGHIELRPHMGRLCRADSRQRTGADVRNHGLP